MSFNTPSSNQSRNLKKAAILALGVAAAALAVKDKKDVTSIECFAKAAEHPENFKVKKCDQNSMEADIVGPTTIKIRDKVFTVTFGQGEMKYTQPNFLEVSTGIDYSIEEPKTEPPMTASQPGDTIVIPEGTTLYRDLKTGKVSTNPEDIK